MLLVTRALLLSILAACSTDPAPAPLPRCAAIDAPTALLCNRGGLCTLPDGTECCALPVNSTSADPLCEVQP